MTPRAFVFLFLSIAIALPVNAQVDTLAYQRKKLLYTNAAVAVVGGGSITALSLAWYKDGLKKFNVFDDDAEWLQMDKAGHFAATYNVTQILADAYRDAGLPADKAALRSSVITFSYMSIVEVFDGFSKGYGFSASDIIANEAGCFAAYLASGHPGRFTPSIKYSYHSSGLASVNPGLLGSNSAERMIKDYNGQTYWLSVPLGIRRFEWLCGSLGYSIDNMVRARKEQSISMGYSPYRQYFLSADIDLTRLPVNNKTFKKVASVIRFVKIPFPTIEFSQDRFKFRPLYF